MPSPASHLSPSTICRVVCQFLRPLHYRHTRERKPRSPSFKQTPFDLSACTEHEKRRHVLKYMKNLDIQPHVPTIQVEALGGMVAAHCLCFFGSLLSILASMDNDYAPAVD